MKTYLPLEKIYDALEKKLIEYQKKFPPDEDFMEEFELNIKPAYFNNLTVNAVISTLKEYTGIHSLCPFCFTIKDKVRNKEIFRVQQSRSDYPAWELIDLTKQTE